MNLGLIHTELLLAGVAIAWIVGALSLWCARRSETWGDRRAFHLLALLAPLGLGGVLGGTTLVMLVRGCHLFSFWDTVLSFLLLASAGGVHTVSLFTTMRRTLRARRLVASIAEPCTNARVIRAVKRLAKRLDMTPPAILQCRTARPLACAIGVRRPAVLLSTWMIARLDTHELEAVLAHELAHLRHRDNMIAWVASWLKEGLFFLPSAAAACRAIHAERELVSDAVAAHATRRPLALASALVKVAEQNLKVKSRSSVPDGLFASFGGEADVSVEARVTRLLEPTSGPRPGAPPYSPWTLGAVGLGLLLTLAALLPFYLMPSGDGSSCLMMAM